MSFECVIKLVMAALVAYALETNKMVAAAKIKARDNFHAGVKKRLASEKLMGMFGDNNN